MPPPAHRTKAARHKDCIYIKCIFGLASSGRKLTWQLSHGAELRVSNPILLHLLTAVPKAFTGGGASSSIWSQGGSGNNSETSPAPDSFPKKPGLEPPSQRHKDDIFDT